MNEWTKWTNSNTLSNELKLTDLHSNSWKQVNKWTKWTNSNTWSNELRFIDLHSNLQEQMNNVNKVSRLKYLVKWIEFQKTSFISSRTSGQVEKSVQTQILSQMNWDLESFIQIIMNKWTRWTNSNTSPNELRFRKLHWNPCEQVNKVNKVNKLKYLVKWIEIQRALFKSSRTSEQGEQSEQTQILGQMNWVSESFIHIIKNKRTRWKKWTNSNN